MKRVSSKLHIIRPKRLAELFDVNMTTIWRWRKAGVLPPPVQIGPGIKGWTEDEIAELIEQRRQVSDA
jgi:predicted DNA-binding transcriptional regulator AlpA